MSKKAARFLSIFSKALIVTNLILLDILFFRPKNGEENQSESITKPVATSIQEEEEQVGESYPIDTCPTGCLEKIKEATASLKTISEPIPVKETSKKSTTTTSAKIYYVPLGSARITSQNVWKDTGAQAYVDFANYTNVKEVYFEASMYLPSANGRAYARLFNVSDNVEVWNSEVWVESSTPTLVTSVMPIRTWNGNKLYRAQMKTSMGFEGVLDSARIKITAD